MAGFPRLKPGQGRVNEPASNTGSPACPPKHFHRETRSTHGTHAAAARSAIDSDSTGSQSRRFLRKKNGNFENAIYRICKQIVWGRKRGRDRRVAVEDVQ